MIVLILLSYTVGTSVKVSNVIFDIFDTSPREHERRTLTVAENSSGIQRQHYTHSPEPVRSFARATVAREQRDMVLAKLRAVENRLQSLQATPPILQQNPQHIGQTSTPVKPIAPSSGPEHRPSSQTPTARTQKDVEFCREHVFTAQQKPVEQIVLHRTCNNPSTKRFDVCKDLADFTGLTMDEVMKRMARTKQYHFEEEHLFWNPQSTTELAWYYSTSQSYLFANSIHGALTTSLDHLKKDIHEPVLDYSGGVGNSVLYLAMERGLRCQYFGIGMIEKSFAEFRVTRRGLQDKISFLSPWSEGTGWKFDPILSGLPRDGSLGAILAIDVLEHIPTWRKVVEAMVDSIRVGGVIIENTPFAPFPVRDGVDTRIHVHSGGISMKEAMGNRMIYRGNDGGGYWEKIRDADLLIKL